MYNCLQKNEQTFSFQCTFGKFWPIHHDKNHHSRKVPSCLFPVILGLLSTTRQLLWFFFFCPLISFFCSRISFKWIVQYIHFCVWSVSISITLLRIILVVVTVRSLFLSMNGSPLHECTVPCWQTPGWLQPWAIISKAAVYWERASPWVPCVSHILWERHRLSFVPD